MSDVGAQGGAVAIRVALFEDDARFRAGVETLLRYTEGMACVASFPLIGPGLAAARRDPSAWDVVLMDLDLPDGSGVDAIRALRALRADLPVLALTVFEEPRTVLQAICAGASGYLLKRATALELKGAVKAAAAGGAPLTPAVAAAVLDAVRVTSGAGPTPTRLDLTARERDVLRALSGGASYQQAADTLGVTLDTVRTHVRALYRKLQVHSVAEAVGRAIREGLV